MKIFSFFFILIITLLSVSAYSSDFTAAAEPEIDAFKCYLLENDIYIINNEEQEKQISLSVGGTAADIIKFSEIIILLKPKENKIIKIYYDTPCEFPEGKYSLDIYFTSEQTEQKLSQTINIYTPNTIFANVLNEEIEIMPCAETKYTINIENPTKINETYKIKTDLLDDEYETEKKIFQIDGFENKTITLKIKPKSCETSGEIKFNTIIETEKTKLIQKIPLLLTIQKEGLPEIAKGIKKIKTDYSSKEVELKIKNLDEKNISYIISLEGPDWITVQKEIQIKSKEEETLKLYFNPTNETEEKEYNITIKLAIPNTHIEYKKEITIFLKKFSIFEKKPYLIYVPILIILLIAAIIIFLKILSKTKLYKDAKIKKAKKQLKLVKILEKNKKIKERKIKDRLKRKEEKRKRKEEIRQKKLELKQKIKEEIQKKKEEKIKRKEEKRRIKEEKRNKKKEIKEKKKKGKQEKNNEKKESSSILKKQITNELKSEFKLIPKKTISEQKQNTPYFFFIVIISIFLIITLKIAGIITSILLLLIYLSFKIKSATTIIKRWRFTEKEEEKTIYSKWKIGLHEINAKILKTVEKAKITIKKIPAKIEGLKTITAFNITTNIANLLTIKNLTFRIRRKFINKNNLEPEEIYLLKQTKTKWQKIKTALIKSDKNYYYLSAEKTSIGDFAIAINKKQKTIKEKKRNLFWIAAIGIFILFLIQPTFSLKAIPEQIWEKDTQQKINLNKYFYDPDSDPLIFTADNTEKIKITFDRGIAILNPEPGWIGEEYTIFHATDPFGEKASSNPVKLTVKEKIGLEKHLKWINLIILGLLLFIVITIIFEPKNKFKN
jgi:PGF-pre-PGF domain-containing protein